MQTSFVVAILEALRMAFLMGWEIFWALILGFYLSAMVQAVVSKRQMSALLPDASFKSLTFASLLGTASSSCSYAAVSIARAIIRKGGNFIAAMGFQMASTNLVIELAILIVLLLGWQFMLAEILGGITLVTIMTLLFRALVPPSLIAEARQQAALGIAGKMEGHAGMDMSMTEGPLLKRIFSRKGFTIISHYFVMDWVSIWKDVVLGLLIAGALAAWVPAHVWSTLFFTSDPFIAKIWGPIIGPVIAMLTFVCSVGNIPLAAVLWTGGMSFGGVLAFIYADLIVFPILDIYRKYYGVKMAAVIFGIYYVSMVLSAYIIEILFEFLGLIPKERIATIEQLSLHYNYTMVLNIIFGILMIMLIYRFFKTNGMKMLKMMG